MEEFQNCPICFEVPEREIYQCSEGHIVCHACIARLTECPQCRKRYGATRTRCRVLETLLDKQEFECKFKDKGCPYMCTRNNISGHGNTCIFNRDLIPLCKMLGWKECKFKLGSCSRAEIIHHFVGVHKKRWINQCRKGLKGKTIKELIQESGPREPIPLLCSPALENNPLFVITPKLNKTTGYFSCICIQLWGAENSVKYKATYTLRKNSSSTSNWNFKIDPLVVGWTLNVYPIREAEYALKKCPIGINISVLEDCKFGDAEHDTLVVEISQ